MYTQKDVREYYNITQIHYEKWWGLKNGLSLHYGIWDEGINSFLESLTNTNRVLMEICDISESDKILDAGCGVGGTAFFLSSNKNTHVVGIRNRIKLFLMFFGKPVPEQFKGKIWSKEFMDWLKEVELGRSARKSLDIYLGELGHLLELEKEMNRYVKQLSKKARYTEYVRLLMSIPSIGLTSAMILLTEIGEIKRFKTFKSLCCYFGLVPTQKAVGRLPALEG